MSLLLDYASPRRVKRGRRGYAVHGTLAAAMSVMAAAAAVWWGATLAGWAQVVNHVPPDAEVLHRSAFEQLFLGGAAWIVVPFMAWQTARFSKWGVRTARCGLLVTIAAWAVCLAFARLP